MSSRFTLIFKQLIYFQLQTLVGRERNPPGESGVYHYRTRTAPWSTAQESFLQYILLLIFFFMGIPRVLDPYPDWIWIQSGQWIRIRIPNPDPDPGGQKLPT